MSTAPKLKPVEAVTITKSNRVKLKLTGTGPQEAINALVRYLDMLHPVLMQQPGPTVDMVAIYETSVLVLDLYEYQIQPQMRLDAAPEVLRLSLSRMEALRLWALAMQDPTGVDQQVQWLAAVNEFHQKIT